MLSAPADSANLIIPNAPVTPQQAAPGDSIHIIHNQETAPDDIYDDAAVEIVDHENRLLFPDSVIEPSSKFPVAEFVTPVAVFTAAALFVRVPTFVHWRKEVQKHLAGRKSDKTEVDNYLQYLPAAAPLVMNLCGYKGEHGLLDNVILLGMSAATFAVLNNTLKFAFKEKRPDSNAHNSFPSGHTGTAFMGAEYMRREYWNSNKFVAMSGYVVATAVGYLRIHNNRHWINDVVGGAALGYLSTTFAYWLYPKIFRKRERLNRERLLQREQKKALAGRVMTAAPFTLPGGGGVSFAYTF